MLLQPGRSRSFAVSRIVPWHPFHISRLTRNQGCRHFLDKWHSCRASRYNCVLPYYDSVPSCPRLLLLCFLPYRSLSFDNSSELGNGDWQNRLYPFLSSISPRGLFAFEVPLHIFCSSPLGRDFVLLLLSCQWKFGLGLALPSAKARAIM